MSHFAACEYAVKGTQRAALALLAAAEQDLSAGIELSEYCQLWLNVVRGNPRFR